MVRDRSLLKRKDITIVDSSHKDILVLLYNIRGG
jgi:hypothetical protein